MLPHSNMFTKVLMKAFCTILPICDYTNLAHNLQKEDNDSSIHEHFLLLRLQALSELSFFILHGVVLIYILFEQFTVFDFSVTVTHLHLRKY